MQRRKTIFKRQLESFPKNKKVLLKLQHHIDFKETYFIPEIENYNESKYLNISLKENFNQLKISSFRVKRHLAFKNLVNQYMSDLYNFKYPFFSYTFFFYSIFITYKFGLFFMLTLSLLLLVCLHHPNIKDFSSYYLDYIFL